MVVTSWLVSRRRRPSEGPPPNMAHLVLQDRLRFVRQDRAAYRALKGLGGGHLGATPSRPTGCRRSAGPKPSDLTPSVTRNVTQDVGKCLKYSLLRISAGKARRRNWVHAVQLLPTCFQSGRAVVRFRVVHHQIRHQRRRELPPSPPSAASASSCPPSAVDALVPRPRPGLFGPSASSASGCF